MFLTLSGLNGISFGFIPDAFKEVVKEKIAKEIIPFRFSS